MTTTETTTTTTVTAPSDQLAVALENTLAIAAPRTTDRPPLAHVHVVVRASEVVFEATDSYAAIRQRCPEAKVEGPDGAWQVHRDDVVAIVQMLKRLPGGFPVAVTLAEQVTVSDGPTTATYPITTDYKFPDLDLIWPHVAELPGTDEPVGFSLDLLGRIAKIQPLTGRRSGRPKIPGRPACFHLNGRLKAVLVRVPEAHAELAVMPTKL